MALDLNQNQKNLIQFEAFFEYASIGILVANKEGIIQGINPFALKEFGYSQNELVGEKIEILIPSRIHDQHIKDREKFTQNPKNRIMGVGRDLLAVRKDGSEFYVEISLGNFKNNEENFVIAFITNITVRKQAEAEIIKLNNDLEEKVNKRTKDLKETLSLLTLSNNKLAQAASIQKAIVENARIMIIATDHKGNIQLFNPEACRNLGFEASEIENQVNYTHFHDTEEIDIKRNELAKEFGKEIINDFEVLVEMARRGIFHEEQYTYIRKDHSRFPVSIIASATRDAHNDISGFMFVAHDISERREFEENLHNSLKREKELNDLKTRFVSMASHEFRTPLSTVLSSAYLIEKYTTTEDQPKRLKHVERIISSTNLLTNVLNDFLNLGKIEEGKIQLRITQFDLETLVKSTMEELQNYLKPNQNLYYQHEGDPIVNLDASLLKHILFNLLSNASKFSGENSSIFIATSLLDGKMILKVRDQGVGISSDDQNHLMERFFRGSNVLHIEGTGLGLYIVSKYAELMNGWVEFKSILNEGSTFTIHFDQKNKIV